MHSVLQRVHVRKEFDHIHICRSRQYLIGMFYNISFCFAYIVVWLLKYIRFFFSSWRRTFFPVIPVISIFSPVFPGIVWTVSEKMLWICDDSNIDPSDYRITKCLVPWLNDILITSPVDMLFYKHFGLAILKKRVAIALICSSYMLTSIWTLVAMVVDLWRHWFWSMANSKCHAPSIFQWHYNPKILSKKFIFSQQIIIFKSFISV